MNLSEVYVEVRGSAERLGADLTSAVQQGRAFVQRTILPMPLRMDTGALNAGIESARNRILTLGEIQAGRGAEFVGGPSGDAAESHGRTIGERMERGMYGKMLRSFGVFAALNMGARSLAGGLKEIEERDIIPPAKGGEALLSLLRIREAQRSIIGGIPLFGELGIAISRAFSDDGNIRNMVERMKELAVTTADVERVEQRRQAMELKAMKAQGVPESEVRARAAAYEQADYDKVILEARSKAGELRQIQAQLRREAAAKTMEAGDITAHPSQMLRPSTEGLIGPMLGPLGGLIGMGAAIRRRDQAATEATRKYEEAGTAGGGASRLTSIAHKAEESKGFTSIAANPVETGTAGAGGIVQAISAQTLHNDLVQVLDAIKSQGNKPLVVGN